MGVSSRLQSPQKCRQDMVFCGWSGIQADPASQFVAQDIASPDKPLGKLGFQSRERCLCEPVRTVFNQPVQAWLGAFDKSPVQRSESVIVPSVHICTPAQEGVPLGICQVQNVVSLPVCEKRVGTVLKQKVDNVEMTSLRRPHDRSGIRPSVMVGGTGVSRHSAQAQVRHLRRSPSGRLHSPSLLEDWKGSGKLATTLRPTRQPNGRDLVHAVPARCVAEQILSEIERWRNCRNRLLESRSHPGAGRAGAVHEHSLIRSAGRSRRIHTMHVTVSHAVRRAKPQPNT
ncbi:hypothetical protein KCU88_g114, partial [Aureobasidium melanogenum]